MARTRTLPKPPAGDTGWKETTKTTYHREIRSGGPLALIAHVAATPRPRKEWTAVDTVLNGDLRQTGLDAVAKTVPEGIDLCDAALATLRRGMQI